MSGNIIPLPESLTLKKWRQKLADQKEKKCSDCDFARARYEKHMSEDAHLRTINNGGKRKKKKKLNIILMGLTKIWYIRMAKHHTTFRNDLKYIY